MNILKTIRPVILANGHLNDHLVGHLVNGHLNDHYLNDDALPSSRRGEMVQMRGRGGGFSIICQMMGGFSIICSFGKWSFERPFGWAFAKWPFEW